MDVYENLANAIILKAVKDYRRALKALRKNPDYKPAQDTKEECEEFFCSEWIQMLSSIDGETLMLTLQREVV